MVDIEGSPVVFAAEHDPFGNCRARCALLAYDQAAGVAGWRVRTIDTRFEHHDGLAVARTDEGWTLFSHAWLKSLCVRRWDVQAS